MDGTGPVEGEEEVRWPLEVGRNCVARRGKDSIGRVAADGEAGADYASHTEGGGRGYELVTVSPEAWAIIWMKSVDEIIE